MLKTTVSVFVGILLAVGAFLYIRMEIKDHARLNEVVNFLNSQIQAAQPLPAVTK